MSSLDLIWDSLPLKDQVAVLRHELTTTNRRVGEMERKFRKMRPNLCLEVIGFLKEIASLKEWIIGIILLALLLKGSISPADVKSILLSSHGAE